jgi:hypothetical protein
MRDFSRRIFGRSGTMGTIPWSGQWPKDVSVELSVPTMP